MSELRPIRAMTFPDVPAAELSSARPKFRDVDPRELFVDEAYQRNLSERSVGLIRKIVGGWDWKAFKPPVVVEVDGRLHVVDGQHTAIGAASHGGIASIPVMQVEAGSAEDRAGAFVKHNRDRIAATPTQLHFALVAAGDDDALTIHQVCERAGARVLRNPPGDGRWNVGDTVAVTTLGSLVRRRFAKGAREVLQICVEAKLQPISAASLKAVEEIMFGESYAGQVLGEDLVTSIRELGPGAEREAARFAAEHDLPQWKGLVVVWFKNTKKVRRGSRAAA